MLGALLAVVFLHPSEDLPRVLWRPEPPLRVARPGLDRARVDGLLSFGGDERAQIERQLASVALTWLLERQAGCTLHVTTENDPARASAEFFGELLHPRFASPRAAQWALWRAVALERHQALDDLALHAEVARAFDDAFARLVAAGAPDASAAGLAAIAHWELVAEE